MELVRWFCGLLIFAREGLLELEVRELLVEAGRKRTLKMEDGSLDGVCACPRMRPRVPCGGGGGYAGVEVRRYCLRFELPFWDVVVRTSVGVHKISQGVNGAHFSIVRTTPDSRRKFVEHQ